MAERALAAPASGGAGRHRRPAVSGITAVATRATASMVSEAPSSILRQCLKLQQVMYRLLTEHRTGVQHDLLGMDMNVCLPLSRLDFHLNYV